MNHQNADDSAGPDVDTSQQGPDLHPDDSSHQMQQQSQDDGSRHSSPLVARRVVNTSQPQQQQPYFYAAPSATSHSQPTAVIYQPMLLPTGGLVYAPAIYQPTIEHQFCHLHSTQQQHRLAHAETSCPACMQASGQPSQPLTVYSTHQQLGVDTGGAPLQSSSMHNILAQAPSGCNLSQQQQLHQQLLQQQYNAQLPLTNTAGYQSDPNLLDGNPPRQQHQQSPAPTASSTDSELSAQSRQRQAVVDRQCSLDRQTTERSHVGLVGQRLEKEHGRTPLFGHQPDWWGEDGDGGSDGDHHHPHAKGASSKPHQQQQEQNSEDEREATAPPHSPPAGMGGSRRHHSGALSAFAPTTTITAGARHRDAVRMVIPFERATSSPPAQPTTAQRRLVAGGRHEQAAMAFTVDLDGRNKPDVGRQRRPAPSRRSAPTPPTAAAKARQQIGSARSKGVDAKQYLLNKMLGPEQEPSRPPSSRARANSETDAMSEAGTYVLDIGPAVGDERPEIEASIAEDVEIEEARRNIDRVFGIDADRQHSHDGSRTPSPQSRKEPVDGADIELLTPRNTAETDEVEKHMLLTELLKMTNKEGHSAAKVTPPATESAAKAKEKTVHSHRCHGGVHTTTMQKVGSTAAPSMSTNFGRRDGGRYSMRGGSASGQVLRPSVAASAKRLSQPIAGKETIPFKPLKSTTTTGTTVAKPKMDAWLRRKEYNPLKAAQDARKKKSTADSQERFTQNRSMSFHLGEEASTVHSKVAGRQTSELRQRSSERSHRSSEHLHAADNGEEGATEEQYDPVADYSRSIRQGLTRLAEEGAMAGDVETVSYPSSEATGNQITVGADQVLPSVVIATRPIFDNNVRYAEHKKAVETDPGLLTSFFAKAIMDKLACTPEMLPLMAQASKYYFGYPVGDRIYGTGAKIGTRCALEVEAWFGNHLGKAIQKCVPEAQDSCRFIEHSLKNNHPIPMKDAYKEVLETALSDFDDWEQGVWSGNFGDIPLVDVYRQTQDLFDRSLAIWRKMQLRQYHKNLRPGDKPVTKAWRNTQMTKGELAVTFYEKIVEEGRTQETSTRPHPSSSGSISSGGASGGPPPPKSRRGGYDQRPYDRGGSHGGQHYPAGGAYRGQSNYQPRYNQGNQGYQGRRDDYSQQYSQQQPLQQYWQKNQQRGGYSQSGGTDRRSRSSSQQRFYQGGAGGSNQGETPRGRQGNQMRRSASKGPFRAPRGSTAEEVRRQGMPSALVDAIVSQKQLERDRNQQVSEPIHKVITPAIRILGGPGHTTPSPIKAGGGQQKEGIVIGTAPSTPVSPIKMDEDDDDGEEEEQGEVSGSDQREGGSVESGNRQSAPEWFPPSRPPVVKESGTRQSAPEGIPTGRPPETHPPPIADTETEQTRVDDDDSEVFTTPPAGGGLPASPDHPGVKNLQENPVGGSPYYMSAMALLGCILRDDTISSHMYSADVQCLTSQEALQTRKYMFAEWIPGKEKIISDWETTYGYQTAADYTTSYNLRYAGINREKIVEAKPCCRLDSTWYKYRGQFATIKTVRDYGRLTGQFCGLTAFGEPRTLNNTLPPEIKVLLLGDSTVALLGPAMISAANTIRSTYPHLPSIWGYRTMGKALHGQRMHEIARMGLAAIDKSENLIIIRGQLDGADVLLGDGAILKEHQINEMGYRLAKIYVEAMKRARPDAVVIMVLPALVSWEGCPSLQDLMPQAKLLELLHQTVVEQAKYIAFEEELPPDVGIFFLQADTALVDGLKRLREIGHSHMKIDDLIRGVHLTYLGQSVLAESIMHLAYKAMMEMKILASGQELDVPSQHFGDKMGGK